MVTASTRLSRSTPPPKREKTGVPDKSEPSRKPLDPALLAYVGSVRTYVIASTLLAAASTAATVVIAAAVSSILASIITDHAVRSFAAQRFILTVLVGAIVARVVITYAHGRVSGHASRKVVAELRAIGLRAVATMTSRELAARRDELSTVLTRGLDGFTPYLTGYIPALLLSCIVPPSIIAVLLWVDPTSALIVAVTLPLIPLFMVLIGYVTRDRTRARMAAMTRLSARMMDLTAGIPTLHAMGRVNDTKDTLAAQVHDLGQRHRKATMGTLRVAFVSSMVLEMLATLCVALVAVSIGLRLVFGEMPLQAGIMALIIAPEVYLPLRQIGAQYHACEDGMHSARVVMNARAASANLSTRLGATTVSAPTNASSTAQPDQPGLRSISVWGHTNNAPANLNLTVTPGRLVVLTGPNGAGKSTAVACLLGLQPVDSGEVTPLPWDAVSWQPQHVAITPGTIGENYALTDSSPDRGQPDTRDMAAGFGEVIERRGWNADATTLSAGERQRLALARTLHSQRPVLLLDEPTAHLNAELRDVVLSDIRTQVDRGSAVLAVSHDLALIEAADTVVEVSSD